MSQSLNGVSCLSVPVKAIHMETDPQMISAYLIYLSQHAPVEEQASHNDLALVIKEYCFFLNQFCSKWSRADIKPHPQSPSAGRCPAYRRTLHHHEQLVLQTFEQA